MKCRAFLSMMICCLLAPSAIADDDGTKTEKKEVRRRVIVKVDGDEKEAKAGKAVRVQVLNLGDALKNASPEVRKQIEENIKKAGKKSSINVFSKGFKVGADGKLEAIDLDIKEGQLKIGGTLKGLPKEIREKIEAAMKGADFKAAKGSKARAIIIGADGAKKEVDLSIDNGKLNLGGALKGLPKEIRLKVEAAVKGAEHKHGDHKHGAKTIFGKAVVVGPDGKKHEIDLGKSGGLKGLPHGILLHVEEAIEQHKKGAAKGAQGKAIVIGPDGKKREIKLGGVLNLGGLNGLPKEVQKEIELTFENPVPTRSGRIKIQKKSESKEKSVTDKLDLILRRLDQMEKQIKELRAKSKN